jgi:hypothetical protein
MEVVGVVADTILLKLLAFLQASLAATMVAAGAV